MMVQLGREHLSFAQALDAEEERQRMNWSCGWRYRANGFYYCLLQPYLERFPREQIRIYLYDDWDMKPLEVLRDIFRFLQMDNTFIPKVARYDVSWLPRSHSIQAFITTPHPLKKWLKPCCPPGCGAQPFLVYSHSTKQNPSRWTLNSAAN